MIWTRIAQKKIESNVNFLKVNLYEVLSMTVNLLIKLEKDGKLCVYENRRKILKDRKKLTEIFVEELHKPENLYTEKFENLSKFIKHQSQKHTIYLYFIYYRIANLFFISSIIYYLHHYTYSFRSTYNCAVPFSPEMSRKTQEVWEMVSCNISGVHVRKYITDIWIVAYVFVLIAGVTGSYLDLGRRVDAYYLLKMAEPVLDCEIIECSMSPCQTKSIANISDLTVLLMLADKSFSTNKVMSMCNRAKHLLLMEKTKRKRKELEHAAFIYNLSSIILWHKKEKYRAFFTTTRTILINLI